MEKIKHIGFCLDEYKAEVCKDCSAEKECLELYKEEQAAKVKKDAGSRD